MEITKQKPTLNQIISVIDLLKKEKENEHLKIFDFDNRDTIFDILKEKSVKQIGYINFLILNNKYQKLNRLLIDWKFPIFDEFIIKERDVFFKHSNNLIQKGIKISSIKF